MYTVFIVQAYQTSTGFLSTWSRHTLWERPANSTPFIRQSTDQRIRVTEASLYSAPFRVFMARERYNFEQRVFIYDCYVKKLIQIVQEKISP
jgi:hypothetical protein